MQIFHELVDVQSEFVAWLKSATLSGTIIIEFLESHYAYIYIFFLKKIFQIYYRTYHKPLSIFASSAKWKAMRLQVRFVFILYDGVLHFSVSYSTIVSLPRSVCIYTDISFGAILHTLIFPYYLYLVILRVYLEYANIYINIYTCYFYMNIIHLYLFCVLWYSIVSQTFYITYSRISFLCLVVLLALGRIKRTLYYLLFDIWLYYLRLKTFEFKGSNPA